MPDVVATGACRTWSAPRALLPLACAWGLATAPAWAQQEPAAGWQPADPEQALREAAEAPPTLQAPRVEVPAMRERAATQASVPTRGFRIGGVGEHPRRGITPGSIQALLDERFRALAGDADEVALDFDQLQDVAKDVTAAYREAGFVVATAYVPVQTVGADGIVALEVLEGRVGRVLVEGNRRVRSSAIAAPARRLEGRSLHRDEVDTALLTMRDLPGVGTSVVLQPGQAQGETDIVVTATEEARPYSVSLGASNHGTELTGRYRGQVGLTYRNALGLGDVVSAGYVHGFSPEQSTSASLGWTIPVHAVDGLSVSAAYARSEMEVNSGRFAALDAATGEEIWREMKPGIRVRESMGISESGEHVHVKTMEGQVFGISTTADQMDVVWTSSLQLPYELTPSAIEEMNEIVFVPSHSGLLSAVSARDGRVLWQYKISNAMINPTKPVAKRSVFASTMDGKIVRIDWKTVK